MQLSCKNSTGSLYWADSVMMRTILIPLVSILLFFVQFPVRSDTVAVAGGLFPCVSELADLYNDMAGEAPGLAVGSSGKLAGQIAAGAPFGLTLMIAGNIPGRTQTLPLYIYSQIEALEFGKANVAAVLLIAVGIASLALVKRMERGRHERLL